MMVLTYQAGQIISTNLTKNSTNLTCHSIRLAKTFSLGIPRRSAMGRVSSLSYTMYNISFSIFNKVRIHKISGDSH